VRTGGPTSAARPLRIRTGPASGDRRAPASQDEVFLNGTIVLPHKEIKETVLDPGTIIM